MTGDSPPVKYATFNSRLIASTIDLSLLMFVAMPLTTWLAGMMFEPLNLDNIVGVSQIGQLPDMQLVKQVLIKGLPQIIVTNLLQLVFIALYILPFWFRFSATPGKYLLRIEIHDVATGERMTRKQSVMRFIGYIIAGLPFTLGFVWVLFNKKRRGWHDFFAHTVVIVKPKKKV